MTDDNYIPHLITFSCAVGISILARTIAVSNGADNFTATGICLVTILITFSLFLTLQSLIRELYHMAFKSNVSITEIEQYSSTSPTESSFNYVQHRQEALMLKAKEEQEKIDAVIVYSQKTLAPYMRESELTQLCGEINAFLTSSWTPEKSKSFEVSQLKSIDLMHFGWNIAQPFKIPRKETALFLKKTFSKALDDVEISTIQRKLTNTESKSLISLVENICNHQENTRSQSSLSVT